jgi:hypothetical protein
MPSPNTTDFSIRDLSFLVDRVNQARVLGLSIDPDSFDIRDGALWFKAAYWGDIGKSVFAAPFEQTNEAVRLQCIVNPKSPDAKLYLNEQGIPRDMKPVAWAADGTGMSLTVAERDAIPQDFSIEPWPMPNGFRAEPRNVADIMASRIKGWDAGRDALVAALTSDATEEEVASPPKP